MEPQELTALIPRPLDDVAAMAIAVQANLVQLKVVQSRRAGVASDLHEIRATPPGAVTRFREALIPRELLSGYDDVALGLRSHEIWGQFCLFCWFFHIDDPHRAPSFARMPAAVPSRCPASLAYKTLEIERVLWRLRFEQRFRGDAEFKNHPRFDDLYQAAMNIPAMVLGQSVQVCRTPDLLLGSCEFAGMLAAARWIGDDRWSWGQDGIMDLPGEPPL